MESKIKEFRKVYKEIRDIENTKYPRHKYFEVQKVLTLKYKRLRELQNELTAIGYF